MSPLLRLVHPAVSIFLSALLTSLSALSTRQGIRQVVGARKLTVTFTVSPRNATSAPD